MKELRKTEGGEGWGGGGVVWSLGDLYDEYGTMHACFGLRLGLAKATMELHVKEMPSVKRKRLSRIIGDFSMKRRRKMPRALVPRPRG